MDRGIIKLFKDFYYLDNTDLEHMYPDQDVYLDNMLLARVKSDGVYIYYLESSYQIYIPLPYVNIFLGFWRLEGDRIMHELKNNKIEKNTLDDFLVLLSRLCAAIFSRAGVEKEGNLRSVIMRLISTKTLKFREMMKTEYNLSLPEIIIESVNEKFGI